MEKDRWYTDEELEEAKEFLRRRIENELSMKRDVESLLTEYAEILLSMLFRGASQDEIDALTDEMCAQLLDDCEILAVDERQDDRDTILLWMNSERNGDNLEGRILKRCRTFVGEVSAVYLAGKILGKNELELLDGIVEHLKNPWENAVLSSAKQMIMNGLASGDVSAFEEPHYGKGHEVSSFGALVSTTVYAIADAWMFWQYEDARKRGAKGYFVERGSSYPCEECDSHTGIFYPMSDEDNRPQYHRNCCCVVIYSYVDRL